MGGDYYKGLQKPGCAGCVALRRAFMRAEYKKVMLSRKLRRAVAQVEQQGEELRTVLHLPRIRGERKRALTDVERQQVGVVLRKKVLKFSYIPESLQG